MNILVLVESLKINGHSGAIVSSTFIEALITYEHTVSLLYSDKITVTNEKNPKPIWLKCKQKKFYLSDMSFLEKCINIFPKVRGIPTYIDGFGFSFNRLVNDWRYAINKEIKKNNYDLVIALGVGTSFAPHFAMAEGSFNIKWIANYHDPFPMSNYPPPYQKKENILYKKQAKRMGNVIQQASFVTFPSLRLNEWMGKFYNLNNKSFVIPHTGISLSNLPTSKIDKNVSLKIDKLNFLHAGSLLGPRNPKYLIKAFLKFINGDSERKEKCVLNIIGKTAKEHSNFENTYNNYTKNINIVIDRISYSHSRFLLKQADVLILLEANSTESPFMPGKLADYIVSDRPILALTPKNSETSRLLGEAYPYITEMNNVNKIHDILVELWDEWKNKKPIKHNNTIKQYISAKNINDILIKNIDC